MGINIVKVAKVTGMLLGIAGTMISTWANNKSTDDTIAKKVADAFAEQAKEL